MRYAVIHLSLLIWSLVGARSTGATAASSLKDVIAGCDPWFSQAISADSQTEPRYYFSSEDYMKYLNWLRHEFGDNQRAIRNTFASALPFTNRSEIVLEALSLTKEGLLRIKGPVLLAGEASRAEGSLHAAFVESRADQRNKDVVNLDLIYQRRTNSSVEGTIIKMPFRDASFGFIASYMVAHYLRKNRFGLTRNYQPDFVLEVIRLLKPGGEARLGPFLNGEDEDEITGITTAAGERAKIELLTCGRKDAVVLKIIKPRASRAKPARF